MDQEKTGERSSISTAAEYVQEKDMRRRSFTTSIESAPSPMTRSLRSVSSHVAEQIPEPHMGLLSSCNMIVGLIIGSGIFASPGPVTLKVGAAGTSLVVWSIAGVLSYLGAMCYAELGTMITKSGGEYQYLRQAYGLCMGLTFTWSNLLLTNGIGTASISTVFAQYILQMAYFDPNNPAHQPDMPDYALKLVAIACIWTVVAFNCFARKAGTWVQNIFTAAKLIALAMIIIIGFIWLGKGGVKNLENAFEGSSTNALDYGTSLYLALFSYNGWNNLNYGISEVKNPKKVLPIAITISCFLVTGVYVLANIAYFATLPVATVAKSTTVAMQLGLVAMGNAGAYFFALMVVLSTFGAVNGNVWAASRLVATCASEDSVFIPPFFGKLHSGRGTPVTALILVGIIATIWCIPGDFTYLAKMYSFTGWLFYGITIAGLVVMRFKKKTKDMERPFKIWLPLAIFFVIIDCYLVIAPLVDAGSEGVYQYIICVIVGLLGIPLWYIRVKKPEIGRKLFGWLPFYEDAKILRFQQVKLNNRHENGSSPSDDSHHLDEKVLQEEEEQQMKQ
ncbi:amino acid permease-domain-containing protein [Halteromyces radiatus]|uniref:amino acid permease-domain-containing protein n=1 Tax=Halteromyces radiatus TaxID=101107 RepID=UPI002220D6BD|nr:amino acid permease-domain-containing protein [Halteromyces radiatus]KAI8098989.1 amino acid permease-domain-containing protein [Halteromyces radiatus]